RPYGALFDESFPLPAAAAHQTDRDLAVAAEFLRRDTPGRSPPQHAPRSPSGETPPQNAPWILSVWTRTPAKDCPLPRWGTFTKTLEAEGVGFAVLHAPDGAAGYQAFRARWSGRGPFVEGSLDVVAARVRACAGVIAPDNCLGHMAVWYGKPVV